MYIEVLLFGWCSTKYLAYLRTVIVNITTPFVDPRPAKFCIFENLLAGLRSEADLEEKDEKFGKFPSEERTASQSLQYLGG
jgi:hypothetical protein